jgi:hypothetical protein
LLADQDQLMQFDKKGEFLGNLQKKGEGPGEWGQTLSLLADARGFALLSYNPLKLLLFDRSFAYIEELKFTSMMNIMRLVRHLPEAGHFFSVKIDFGKIKTGIQDSEHLLHRYNKDGRIDETGLAFKQKLYSQVVRNEQQVQVAMAWLTPFTFAAVPTTGRMLLACHDEYRLELVDLNEEKTISSLIRRQFQRQPWRPDPQRKRMADAPKVEYFNAVPAVVSCGEDFWVFTSSLDAKKGVQVDVISGSGAYLDRFWLPLPGLDYPRLTESLAVSAGHIAWVHQDEDENPIVTVYSYALR